MHKLVGSRPRIEGGREEEILEATLELLLEVGYDRLTLDAVARRARASKATLYRRWDGKPSLVVEAMVRAKQAPEIAVHDTGTLRGDLVSTFCGLDGLQGNSSGMLASVVTALASDPEFATLFREAFIAPKIAVSREIYARAIARGEISPETDVEVIAPALAGIVLHRSFVLGATASDDATVERVIDRVILPAVGLPADGRPSHPLGTKRKHPRHDRHHRGPARSR